ncbi:MAG: hypothetical protein EOM59_21270 [Clostridia bacterium]|jgi:hypothetical protein|nr:hypothetical protein [Clostridia bacterium]
MKRWDNARKLGLWVALFFILGGASAIIYPMEGRMYAISPHVFLVKDATYRFSIKECQLFGWVSIGMGGVFLLLACYPSGEDE